MKPQFYTIIFQRHMLNSIICIWEREGGKVTALSQISHNFSKTMVDCIIHQNKCGYNIQKQCVCVFSQCTHFCYHWHQTPSLPLTTSLTPLWCHCLLYSHSFYFFRYLILHTTISYPFDWIVNDTSEVRQFNLSAVIKFIVSCLHIFNISLNLRTV